MKDTQETHQPPAVVILESTEVPTISRQETNGNVFLAAEETQLLETIAPGKEDIQFVMISREVMAKNGNHGSDYETETTTTDNATKPEPTTTGTNNLDSHHNSNALKKPTSTGARGISMSRFVLVLLLVMTCTLFRSLWLHKVNEHTIAVQELEQQLFKASQISKREIQGLKKDLEAWMGRSRQLEQQKRDMGEEFQLRLKMAESKNNEKALD